MCLKGTTLAARLGNPAHRLAETPGGMLNAIGLQNPGARAVVDTILPTLDFGETRFIANVSGSTVEEYEEVTRIFDDSPIDAIEINISCPNVKEGGVQFGNYPEMSARVVAACRAVTKKPIITKLSPNQTDIKENARRCIEAGTDGFAVINTLMGMAIDIEQRRPVLGNNQGGLSGPAIKPVAVFRTFQVAQVARPHGIPIIGQGGVTSAADAIEFLLAGASAAGWQRIDLDPATLTPAQRTALGRVADPGTSHGGSEKSRLEEYCAQHRARPAPTADLYLIGRILYPPAGIADSPLAPGLTTQRLLEWADSAGQALAAQEAERDQLRAERDAQVAADKILHQQETDATSAAIIR